MILRQIEKQQAEVKYLTEQAAAQHIITPISGVVRIVSEGDDFLTVTDSRKVELDVPVTDFDIDLVKLGQPASIKVRSFPHRTYHGAVIRIPFSAEGDSLSGVFDVSLEVANESAELKSGMTGYAKINTGSTTLAGLLFRKLLSIIRVEFWSWW